MSRDLVDQFIPRDRGRFGGDADAPIRGNDSVRSNLVDVTCTFCLKRDLSIAVTQGDRRGKWIWLPLSKIEFTRLRGDVIQVSMPEWLAKEKGLI